jgi:Bacterial regulatory helix-turn-helix protein, lysR family
MTTEIFLLVIDNLHMSSPLSSVLRNRLYARARIRHLQVLLQIAELGSVRKAAQLMNLTQPTVTHLLGDLEKLLDYCLWSEGCCVLSMQRQSKLHR